MAPLWPNDPKTSILVRRRGSDSDGPACVDGARVSVQETKTRDLPGFGYLKRSARTLDNFVEAPGHVNIFGCTKFGQTARYCKPQTVSHVCGNSSTVSSVNGLLLVMKNQMVLWFCRHAVFLGSLFASRTCEPAFLRPSEEESESRSCRSFAMSSCGRLNVFLAIL